MVSPPFIDTHAHLDYPEFAADLPEVLERARAAGITRVISIGTNFESSTRAIQLAERFEGVFAVAGWHPGDVLAAPADLRPQLRELARHPKVVALGETGLDFHHLPSEQPGAAPDADAQYQRRQRELFRQHLEVCADTGLNCIIHQRDALTEVLQELEPFAAKVRGVFHCFVDPPAAMERVRALGSLVSFTGITTFKNAATVRETVAATPLGSFMLETDCPFLAPVPFRGKRCEPAYVKQIGEVIAGLKGCSLETLSEQTRETAELFFPKLCL